MKGKNIDKKMIYIIGFVVLLVIIVILMFTIKGSNGLGSSNLKCSINNKLLDGFNNEENVTFRIKGDMIKEIHYDRVITLENIYSEDETYIKSLNISMNNAYNYLDNKADIKKDSNQIRVKIDIDDKYISLNNLSIKNNSNDNTSLRYDVDDTHSFKIGDKYNTSKLKEKVEELGYTCN